MPCRLVSYLDMYTLALNWAVFFRSFRIRAPEVPNVKPGPSTVCFYRDALTRLTVRERVSHLYRHGHPRSLVTSDAHLFRFLKKYDICKFQRSEIFKHECYYYGFSPKSELIRDCN